jgi:hypothetical protein
MYKPNGEERMSVADEKRLKDELAVRRLDRFRAADQVAEAIGTSMYAQLLRASDPREDLIAASFIQTR